ncbi:MAG: YoaK family protein [Chitinophagales bacterium]
MFRHAGKRRTYTHNVQLASLLSLVAGLVNVTGFIAVQRLTTNVTGHFAFFVDEVYRMHFAAGAVYFLYIFFFFIGSFFSNVMIELALRFRRKHSYYFPAATECLLLCGFGWASEEWVVRHPNFLAYGLLFAMGMQNSLVTTISNAAVRTTHLTGLFTDLGIELSQLFFFRKKEEQAQLWSVIKLRLTIIGCFFSGGLLGGLFYAVLGLRLLLMAGLILVAAMFYDSLKLRWLLYLRSRQHQYSS